MHHGVELNIAFYMMFHAQIVLYSRLEVLFDVSWLVAIFGNFTYSIVAKKPEFDVQYKASGQYSKQCKGAWFSKSGANSMMMSTLQVQRRLISSFIRQSNMQLEVVIRRCIICSPSGISISFHRRQLYSVVCYLFCVLQSTAKLVDPLDYENVIVKNRTLLQNDPQREMLLFPHDDLSVSLFIVGLTSFCNMRLFNSWTNEDLRRHFPVALVSSFTALQISMLIQLPTRSSCYRRMPACVV